MAITIQHGLQGGTAAGQIIAQAGQANLQRQQQAAMQINQLNARREMQMQQIQAQADRQRQATDAAYARTALQGGLEEQLREQEFERSITKVQEQAKAQAAQWEYRYSTEQRQKIARINSANQKVQTDPSFDDEDKKQWNSMFIAEIAGIKPPAIPRDPEKFTFPEGQQVGQFYEENGVLGSRKANGETWQADWRKTQEGQKREHELKTAQDSAKLEIELEKEKREFLQKLYTTEISDGLGKRVRRSDEIRVAFEDVFGARQQQQQSGQPEVMYGAELTEIEKQYPREVGSAIIFMKAMKSKFGSLGDMPEDVKAAWMGSYQTVSDFARSQGG